MRAWIILAAAIGLCACGDIGGRSDKASSSSAAATPAPAPAGPVSSIATASDARYVMEQAGFTNVTPPSPDATGHWIASASYNGQSVQVRIDDQGVPVIVTPSPN
jgi:hypothetical protein